MKKTLLFLFAYVCTITLSGCSTNEAITCYLPANTINSNSPLVPGGTLKLNATDSSLDTKYNWSGPNNFQSNLQNPVISDITPSMAGEYKLKTTKGICESPESSVIVEINAPNIPCNPDTNTLIINGSSIELFSTYTTNYNQNFKFISSSLEASLTIEFASEERPTPGIYTICSDCWHSSMKKNQVWVTLNYADYTSAQGGSVYLSSSNGKLTATFCNVVFKQSVFTFNTSVKLTER
ncbi:hypothetical protein AAEO57_17730 [Flavobacterium sp. DGU38]|uniref:Ig-like domain-containing protein n=1 Tax=Flavobacterium calami TaxID=3139144 RepID=A0ABU9IVF4_9FLAO